MLSSSLHRLRLSAVMFHGVEAAQYAVPGGVWNAVLVCKAQAFLCCVRCCMWRIVGLGLRSSPLLGSCVWLLVTRLLLLLNVEGDLWLLQDPAKQPLCKSVFISIALSRVCIEEVCSVASTGTIRNMFFREVFSGCVPPAQFVSLYFHPRLCSCDTVG